MTTRKPDSSIFTSRCASSAAPPGFLYQELECTPLLQELADRARSADELFRETAAVALAAAAVTELPREILIEFHRDHRMDRMIDYIHDRFRSPLSIEKMATGCGMGVNNFIRRFRECTGCTPYHYLTQVRYAAAARLLEAKELSIDEICAEVGIRDRFHFSRTFKRLYGQAPAAYRKAAGKR
ncbi:MAG: AraC family transcriptional regulator [Lentisphaeria bacterium]|nr:MAG: AraC family transcriptional regulator [Lentisphaeria bacterium]